MDSKRIVCGVKQIRKDKDLSAVMQLIENDEGYSINRGGTKYEHSNN